MAIFCPICFAIIIYLLNRNYGVEAGCLEADICCRGRNLSCKAFETGKPTLAQLETLMQRRRGYGLPNNTNHLNAIRSRLDRLLYNSLQKDMQATQQSNSTVGRSKDDSEGFSSVSFLNEEPITQETLLHKKSNQDGIGNRKYRGVSENSQQDAKHKSEDLVLLDNGAWKNEITYEIVNGDRVSDSVEVIDKESWNVRNKVCYCDELCGQFLDCCSDYRYVCPKVDCKIGKWSKWSPCVSGRRQYYGVMRRSRKIIIQPDHGGKPCPPLLEKRACAIKRDEIAQLLPYSFGRARSYSKNHKYIYEFSQKFKEHEDPNNYCMIYESSWYNTKCSNATFTKSFENGSKVCVECQETARKPHRGRCWGQGKEKTLSFWSILQSKTCFGQWIQQRKKTFCHCSKDFPDLSRYIFV